MQMFEMLKGKWKYSFISSEVSFLTIEGRIRLDYQPLFGKGARAPPPNSLLGEEH